MNNLDSFQKRVNYPAATYSPIIKSFFPLCCNLYSHAKDIYIALYLHRTFLNRLVKETRMLLSSVKMPAMAILIFMYSLLVRHSEGMVQFWQCISIGRLENGMWMVERSAGLTASKY